MSAVQYYLLDGHKLTDLLNLLQETSGTPLRHVTVSQVKGVYVDQPAAQVHLFRVRLTAEQFMNLSVADAYPLWLADGREVEAFTEVSAMLSTKTAGTVDGKFAYAQTEAPQD